MSLKGSIIVTGANGGLGTALVKRIIHDADLAAKHTGVYTVRKADAAVSLKSVLRGAPASHEHLVQEMDLGSLASVRRAAAEINAKVASGELPPVRALILNAAFQEWTELTMSEDGFDMSWQVNYLSNMLLTLLLLQSMDKERGRIAIIGTFSHDIQDPRNKTMGQHDDPKFPTLFPPIDDLARGRWSTPAQDASMKAGLRRYSASKLCVLMFMVELAKRLAKDPKLNNITVVGVDPGGMPTKLMRRMPFFVGLVINIMVPIMAKIMVRFSENASLRPTWKSAADVIRACFEIDSVKGDVLYLDGTTPWPLGDDTRNQEKRKILWEHGLLAATMEQGETALAKWK